MAVRLPRLIALCGHPKSGKSTVQALLQSEYGVVPVDDGGMLRDIAVQFMGLTRSQVSTQEGKSEVVEMLGRKWTVREILGELGNAFEAKFGAHFMPFVGVKQTERAYATTCFSFGSVRRDQGLYYKQHGGVVIGIANPLAGPSPYEFDSFDASAVDFWINNDGQSRGLSDAEAMRDLRGKLSAALFDMPGARAAA